MSIQKSVGQRIKKLRLQKELSQEKLANELGMDRTYIASVEKWKKEHFYQKFRKNLDLFLSFG